MPDRPIAQLIEEPDITATCLLNRPNNEMFVTAQLFAGGEALGLPCRTASQASPVPDCKWNDWLSLPARYSDLPQDACLALTVYDIVAPHRTEIIGGTTLPLFTNGRCASMHIFTLMLQAFEERSTPASSVAW